MPEWMTGLSAFYTSSVIIVEFLMVAMLVHVVRYSGFTRVQKLWFILTFVSVMICTAAEYAVHCGYYDPRFKGILTVLTVIQFSISPLLAVFFTGALGLHKEAGRAVWVFATGALFEIVAAPFGWVFRFTEQGYSRGPLFTVYMVYYFIGLLYLLVGMLIVGRRFRHRDSVTIVMVILMLVAGILPVSFLNIHTAYISIGLGACLCYIYYNDLVQADIQADLVANQKRILAMQTHTISGLANLIESRDTETGEHVARTGAIVKAIAEKAMEKGLHPEEIDGHFIELLTTLAPMHDVGKVVVPDQILRKPGKLTPEEFEEIKKHAAEGGKVVRQILSGISDEEYLKFASDIATYHHEKWDGSGYPAGLKGDEIPLSARIMAIADVYDALISERCYKKAMSVEEAEQVIREEAGTHFDPMLAEVFLRDVLNS